MSSYQISLNQLADFSYSTDAGKRSIIKQQLKPNLLKVPRYQLTKARIRRYFELKGSLNPIYEAIKELNQRTPVTRWQINDRKVSIEALERFIKMKLPKILGKVNYEVIKTPKKILSVDGVDIIVAPEILIKGRLNGKSVIGAVKIHISKTKPFKLDQAQDVASIIYHYLREEVAQKDELVFPELCYCLDVFSDRLVSAPSNSQKILLKLGALCNEIKLIWNKAVA